MNEPFIYNNLIKIGELVPKVLETIGTNTTGLMTGLKVLDNQVRGFLEGDYVIIAGRPSMGKTSILGDIVLNIGTQDTVAVFSLEMNSDVFVERLVANLAKVNYHWLKLGKSDAKDWKSVEWAAQELNNRSILLDDSSHLSPDLLRLKLEYIQQNYGLGCVVIDYIQLMTAGRNENRQQEMTDISRELKALAKDFRVPIIVACQLNRAVEHREDNRPRLSDLRESGSLEQDADKVLLLHRPSYYDLKYDFDAEDTGEADIIVAKNRNGPVGVVKVCWISDYMSFCDTREF